VTFSQALVLALLQGISELFPVSSLGHTILVPALLHWKNVDRAAPSFLAFVVVLHLGTALALIAFYRSEWAEIVRAVVASVLRGRLSDNRAERVGWLLVVATIPVGILGIALENPVRSLFASPAPAAIFLFLNGLLMFAGERLRRKQGENGGRSLAGLTYGQSVLIGFAQSAALLPGISRSGIAMVAGLLFDLNHENAARFSFLLATPVILAAALLEIPKLFAPDAHLVLVQAIVGGIAAGVAAYGSVAFLTRYFRSNDLRPFGWYCVIVGAGCFILARTGAIS
jgi:undecaprenyl-diphosphatase